MELNLETGRTHQIRLHLAHLGHLLLGDSMYGERTPWIKRQALHAKSVVFKHLQDNRDITVEAPLPEDFLEALDFCANPMFSAQ